VSHRCQLWLRFYGLKYKEIVCRQFGPERLVKNWSPKSSVGMVTTLRADRRSPRSLISDRLKRFFSPPVLRVQTAPGAHQASCSDRPWGPPSLVFRPPVGPTKPRVQTARGAHQASCSDRPWGPPSLVFRPPLRPTKPRVH